MAMEVDMVIDGAHDGKVLCTAFNKAKNELYTGGEDHLVKVRRLTECGDVTATRREPIAQQRCAGRPWLYVAALEYLR